MDTMLTDQRAAIVLAHADDKLLLGHLQSDWTGLGPILEEDIAASAMAQDDLSHALILFEYLADRHGLDADVIAFERDPSDYMCCDLVTLPDDFDWAVAVVKRWFVAVFSALGIERLETLDDKALASRCTRIMAEQRLQLEHLAGWIKRLGTASEESRDRMQQAIDRVAEHAGMLFEVPGGRLDPDDDFCCAREDLYQQWQSSILEVLSDTGLTMSCTLPARDVIGGRRGTHASHFTDQLEEMTEVRRVSPGAAW